MISTARSTLDELSELLSEPASVVRDREQHTLERLLRAHRNRVVLFGAGSTGTRALSCLRSIGVAPLAFSDNKPEKWGSIVDGTTVLCPKDAATSFGTNALFIVTIWNGKHRFAETKARLAELGVESISSASALHWRFHERYLPFFSMDLPGRLHSHREGILRTAGLWADDESRAEYLGHLRGRLTGDFDAFPAPVGTAQYFPEFFNLGAEEAFVDCGAFDGDTVREFLRQSRGTFRSVLALEPSPDTYEALATSISGLDASTRSRIRTERYAVGDRAGTVRFDAGDGPGAHISEDGKFTVDVHTLDSLCALERTTYIKMDIEGAELAALAGARATIERDRPILAICVYHRPTDLWQLPLWIHEVVPSYRLYLRSHENDGWDTVAYAVPPERVASIASGDAP